MDEKKTGGPAYPIVCECSSDIQYPGVTIRDKFAIAAMQAILSKYNLNRSEDQDIISQLSYELADSMLAERQK